MQLTRYSDYALRVMIFLAARGDRLCAISEIAAAYAISQNHLMKVLHGLGKAGYVISARGRSGGYRLAQPASAIRVGALLRHTEGDVCLVDCAGCALAAGCGVAPVLEEAMDAFFAVLDKYTIADLVARKPGFQGLILSLGLVPPHAGAVQ
ncbi:Rrf2 family transcriptional regulator [Ancylobacter sp. IITR112]|uniref:RrF2 family transcriptional regulator n=1 Tax=Ancylobacter sp. IITR112 TaxID=3138073 RepID=UPI00352B6D9E